jgi:hypothetical protein
MITLMVLADLAERPLTRGTRSKAATPTSYTDIWQSVAPGVTKEEMKPTRHEEGKAMIARLDMP